MGIYIRIQGEKFGLIKDNPLHKFNPEIDTAITENEYNEFLKLQSEGATFKVSSSPKGAKLFDLIKQIE